MMKNTKRKKEKFILVSSHIENEQFLSLMEKYKISYGLQMQSYYEKIINGFRENNERLYCVSHLQLDAKNKDKYIKIDRKEKDNIDYETTYKINIKYFGNLISLFHIVNKTIPRINNKTVLLVDYINLEATIASIIIRIIKKCKLVYFVTDMPDCLLNRDFSLTKAIYRIGIKMCDGYLPITNRYADVDLFRYKPFQKYDNCIDVEEIESEKIENFALYYGAINEFNNIPALIKAWGKIGKAYNTKLVLYGPIAPEFDKNILYSDCVDYMGVIDNESIKKIQKKALFLINARKIDYDINLYSFPSKVTQYFASGRPVITTKLPCLVNEYDDYVYYFKGDKEDDIENGLQEMFIKSKNELINKGKDALKYMLENKNSKVQLKKVIDFCDKL